MSSVIGGMAIDSNGREQWQHDHGVGEGALIRIPTNHVRLSSSASAQENAHRCRVAHVRHFLFDVETGNASVVHKNRGWLWWCTCSQSVGAEDVFTELRNIEVFFFDANLRREVKLACIAGGHYVQNGKKDPSFGCELVGVIKVKDVGGEPDKIINLDVDGTAVFVDLNCLSEVAKRRKQRTAEEG